MKKRWLIVIVIVWLLILGSMIYKSGMLVSDCDDLPCSVGNK